MCKNFKDRLRILHDMLPPAAVCQNIIPVDYLLNTAAKKPTLRFYKIDKGLTLRDLSVLISNFVYP